MVKRKFYASLIMLIVASMTLVSGTYAWFLVGGFGSLFDIGFDVMSAGAGLEIRGSAGDTTTGWKSELKREDFLEGSFLAAEDKDAVPPVSGGTYKPISACDFEGFTKDEDTGIVNKFIMVNLSEGTGYKSSAEVKPGADYNDFTIYARSSTETPTNLGMKIEITGGKGDDDKYVKSAACNAARVAVTYNNVTTIYALQSDDVALPTTYAVTKTFADGSVKDTVEDRIITNGDDGYANAGLTEQKVVALNDDGVIRETGKTIVLENVVANAGTNVAQEGSEINVKVWIEGNDADCIDFGENSIASSTLTVKISFETAV